MHAKDFLIFSRGDTIGFRHATKLPRIRWALKIAGGHALIAGCKVKATLLKQPLLNQRPLHLPRAESTQRDVQKCQNSVPYLSPQFWQRDCQTTAC